MAKVITEYHEFIDQAPHSAVIRGMIRIAEDSADDGFDELAKQIFHTVISDLLERGEFMHAARLLRSGNKMIGIEPNEKAADECLRKHMETA